MRLGELTLDQPVFIAPMAGVTDKPFREICFEQGGDAAVTEMVSAKALYYKNRGSETLLRRGAGERLLAVQLFGRDKAIAQAEEYIQTARKAIEKYYDHGSIYRYLADLLETRIHE